MVGIFWVTLEPSVFFGFVFRRDFRGVGWALVYDWVTAAERGLGATRDTAENRASSTAKRPQNAEAWDVLATSAREGPCRRGSGKRLLGFLNDTDQRASGLKLKSTRRIFDWAASEASGAGCGPSGGRQRQKSPTHVAKALNLKS